MRLRGTLRCTIALVAVVLGTSACGDATVRVTMTERHQVMKGWEGLLGGAAGCNQTARNKIVDRTLDLVALDLGMNRVRLPLRSGTEDSVDYFVKLRRGEITPDEWKYTWFRPQNDDADPRHANPAGFQWSFLDYLVTTEVLPLRQRLRTRGEELWVNLQYVGGRDTPHASDPEEYAELVVEAFRHLRDTYGLIPQSLDIINEPNHQSKWSPQQVARALIAARTRLSAAGFSPQFVGPSTTTMQHALQYLDGMMAVPGAREALTDFSFHRYGGNVDVLERIARRADSLGLRTAMLERIGADVDTLYQDLTVGNVSTWGQFGMTSCPPAERDDRGGIYVRLTLDDTLHPTVRLAPKSRTLRQFFRYVRLGATRVGASSNRKAMRATAFENTDGGVVVVVVGSRGGGIRVQGLPAGRYATRYSLSSAADSATEEVAASDTTIASGGEVRAQLPSAGVLTIFKP